MTLDKQKVKQIGEEVEEALREVAERHGLELQVRGGSYDSGSFRPKVEFVTANAAEDEFRRYAHLYDLEADDFGVEFKASGKAFRISGLAERSPKRPILATEVSTGRTFKFTPEAAAQALRAAKASV